MKKGIFLFFSLFIFINTSFSADISWKIGATGNWAIPTNWVGDIAPGVNDYAIIDDAVAVVRISTTVTIQGVRLTSGILNIAEIGGILNCTQGTITRPGIWHTGERITNNGTINIAMITDAAGIQLEGIFTNNNTINISNVSNQGINALSGSFNNKGILNIDQTLNTAIGNGLALSANFINSGTISIGATTALAKHGILVNTGILFVNTGTINIDNLSNNRNGILNLGTINNTIGAINIGVNSLINGRGISNSGIIINSADITIDQIEGHAILGNAGSSFSNIGNLKINGGGPSSIWSFIGGGTLINTGTLAAIEDISGGNFTNSGTLSPGQSPGRLNIRDVYNSGVGAKYLAEIGGTTIETEYDQLHFYNGLSTDFNISTTTLEVQLIDGFIPNIGDNFDIMTSAFGYTGNFVSPILPALPSGRGWMLDYTTDITKLTLIVIAVLPVEFTYFKGQKQEDYALLSWQTATELDNKGFEIQKSANTKSWETIGFVKGEGDSYEAVNYSFIDEQPFHAINYYRLKQIDFDGTQDYSSIIQLDFSKHSTINVFPNPSSGLLSIDYDNTNQQQAIQVFSAAGTKVMDTVMIGHSLDLSSLSPGIYFIQIENSWKKISIQ